MTPTATSHFIHYFSFNNLDACNILLVCVCVCVCVCVLPHQFFARVIY